jgi:hypothetical protein
MANVQISEELFVNLVKYHLCGLNTWEDDLNQPIEKALQEKLDSMINRDLYTKYKTGATPEEREKARQEYLDRKGIPTDFRWAIDYMK